MNMTPTDVFALAQKRLEWTSQRQGVLAQNIANANTPGYAARDVKSFGAVLEAQSRQGAGGLPAMTPRSVADLTVADRSIDGNGVVLDEQLEKVAETDTANQLAMNLYKKYTGMFKTALGRN